MPAKTSHSGLNGSKHEGRFAFNALHQFLRNVFIEDFLHGQGHDDHLHLVRDAAEGDDGPVLKFKRYGSR